MTPAQQETARALVALEGWRWVAGMRLVGHDARYPVRLGDGERPFDVLDATDHPEALVWWCDVEDGGGGPYVGPYLPDLTDPATAGLVLQMVPVLSMLHVAERESGLVYRIVHLLDDGRTNSTGWRPTLGEAAARACIAAGRCA